jgi:HAMP domain-containing protein
MHAPSGAAEIPAAAPTARALAGSPAPGSPAPGSPAPERVARAGASLLWRVFAVNAAVFVSAAALLAWAPVTVHRVATPSELVILALGLVAMLVIDLLLLRRTLGPLRRLASMMGEVTPGSPGRRARSEAGAGREVHALAGALNATGSKASAVRAPAAPCPRRRPSASASPWNCTTRSARHSPRSRCVPSGRPATPPVSPRRWPRSPSTCCAASRT